MGLVVHHHQFPVVLVVHLPHHFLEVLEGLHFLEVRIHPEDHRLLAVRVLLVVPVDLLFLEVHHYLEGLGHLLPEVARALLVEEAVSTDLSVWEDFEQRSPEEVLLPLLALPKFGIGASSAGIPIFFSDLFRLLSGNGIESATYQVVEKKDWGAHLAGVGLDADKYYKVRITASG